MNILTFYLLLFSFCLGQLGRFSIFRQDLVIHVNDLVLGITVFSYFFLKLLRKERISLPDFFKPMVAFLFAGVVSLLVNLGNFSLGDIVIGSLYLLRWGVYAMISLIVFNWVKKEKKKY